MALAYGILGFLNYGPMSGYELAKAFESSLDFFWHAQSSQVYLELKKLEKQGSIRGETVIQTQRPNKRVFSITEAGRERFMAWLAEDGGEDTTHFKSAFLMKVFFSGSRTPEQSAGMLNKFKADCEAYLEKMGSIPGSLAHYGSNKEAYETLCWRFTADFGYSFIKMCIEWAMRCVAALEEMEKQNAKEDEVCSIQTGEAD